STIPPGVIVLHGPGNIYTVVPQMECPALSRRVEARNAAPQKLNDLGATLQEEWDAVPQQTISRLVNSMKRRCFAVIYAQGHMTSY
uniref:Uncharacterized protein n=1 Tax=Hippocampus comes TaxID=109280 RepID=A0A3Q2Z3F7_HIPCM